MMTGIPNPHPRTSPAIDVAERLRGQWERTGMRPRDGASTAELARLESRCGFAIPSEISDVYRTVNGAPTEDHDLFTAWPISEIGLLRDVVTLFQGTPNYARICDILPSAHSYLAFGECMMWSQVLAVRVDALHGTTPVVWISGSDYLPVANSFTEFWTIYLRDPGRVLWPKPRRKTLISSNGAHMLDAAKSRD